MYPFPKHAVIPMVQVCKTSTTLRKKMRLTHFAPLRFPFGLPCSPSSCQTRTFSEKKHVGGIRGFNLMRLLCNLSIQCTNHGIFLSLKLHSKQCQNVSNYVAMSDCKCSQSCMFASITFNYIILYHIISYYIHPGQIHRKIVQGASV